MKETYTQMLNRFEKEVDALDLMFAFGNDQFKEVMEQHGWTVEKHPDLYSIGVGGGFATKETAKAFNQTVKRQQAELNEAMKDDDFAISAFKYEAGNHEYEINDYGDEETLGALGLKVDDLNKDPRLRKLYKQALTEYAQEALA